MMWFCDVSVVDLSLCDHMCVRVDGHMVCTDLCVSGWEPTGQSFITVAFSVHIKNVWCLCFSVKSESLLKV